MKIKMPPFLKKAYLNWLKKRFPLTSEVTLSQRRIFILPTGVGLLFVAVILLVFVNAVNYKNNLLFALCFLMVSLFITVILNTYRNLSGLTIKAGHALPVFAEASVSLPITLRAKKWARENIDFGFEGQVSTQVDAVVDATRTSILYTPLRRGYIETPRLKLESTYPMGLLKCWAWLYLDFQGLVYPKPTYVPFKYVVSENNGDEEEGEVPDQVGIDDFRGFKSYQPGDPLKHVAWKQFARGGELLTKEFEETHAGSHWLDWQALAGLEIESRLQCLCGWVLRSHEENMEYGLRLPGIEVKVGRGDHHRDECLTVLATYGKEKPVLEAALNNRRVQS